jgi:hypothetical protein
MKYKLILIFFLFLTTIALAKGGSGTYFIQGKVLLNSKTLLKNSKLKVKIGTLIKFIKTDNNGNYEVEIPWQSACPSGRTKEQNRRDDKKINTKYICFIYNNKKVKLINEWQKYAQLFPKSKDEITRKQDINFTL